MNAVARRSVTPSPFDARATSVSPVSPASELTPLEARYVTATRSIAQMMGAGLAREAYLMRRIAAARTEKWSPRVVAELESDLCEAQLESFGSA